MNPTRIALIILFAVLTVVGLATAVLGGETVSYETPRYRVVETVGQVEMREYAPYLAAETTVDGGLEGAGNRGFRILAKYIFGDNQRKQKIAMTTPVSQEIAKGTKIAMTAPVTQERAGNKYSIQFMMPAEYSRDDLPVPNDERIVIREIPARSFAATRYSGTWSKRNYQKHLDRLVATLSDEGYEPVGEPIWARYNPPFMPWFLRRNEILTAYRTSLTHQRR